MRWTFLLHHRMPPLYRSLLVQALGALVLWLCCLPIVGQAQTADPITSSGLNTEVSPPVTLPSGQTQYNITGGTRPGGGTNLFHSFGDFNVPNNNIANFLNDSGLATSNVLGRVTGENPSVIFGRIQTNGPGGFGNANFFLMNPYGFLFGPNATLNVGGMVAFTTADYLRLQGIGGNGIFYADSAATSIITSAPVAAFGFLGVLLAVPVAATIGVLCRFWLRRYLGSSLYLDPPRQDGPHQDGPHQDGPHQDGPAA